MCHLLLLIPLVLMAPADSDLTSSSQILTRDRIELPLITLHRHDAASRRGRFR